MTARAWMTALKTTHYLDEDQLLRYFDTRLSAIQAEMPENVVIYRGAVWTKGAFFRAKHIRHRALLAEIYCRLLESGIEWSYPVEDTTLKPDAILATGNGPIYVEADTGKENQKQWLQKLQEYQNIGNGALWVVAQGGPVRLSRLQQWITQAHLSIPWVLTPLADVRADLPRFTWPAPATNPLPPEPLVPLSHQYRLVGQVIGWDQLEPLIAKARVEERACQRIHRGVIHFYAPVPSWWRLLIRSQRRPMNSLTPKKPEPGRSPSIDD